MNQRQEENGPLSENLSDSALIQSRTDGNVNNSDVKLNLKTHRETLSVVSLFRSSGGDEQTRRFLRCLFYSGDLLRSHWLLQDE